MAGNPYHDELGQFCSRNKMVERIQTLFTENRTQEAEQLNTQLLTIDRNKKKGKFLTTFKPEIEQNILQHQLKQPHTYIPPTPPATKTEQRDEDHHNNPTKHNQLTKLLRTEFKTAQKNGYLPKNLSYKIAKGKTQNGETLTRVLICNLTDNEIYTNNNTKTLTKEAKELKNRVTNVANSYNKNTHQNSAYHLKVLFEDENYKQNKKQNQERKKNENQRKEKAENLIKTIQEKGFQNTILNSATTFTDRPDGQIARLKNTPYIITKKENHYTFLDNKRGTLYEIYDLTNISVSYAGKKYNAAEMFKILSLHKLETLGTDRRLYSTLLQKPNTNPQN